MKKQNKTFNKWEAYFLSYLEHVELRIERNKNQGDDCPNKYWTVDSTGIWEPEPCESAVDVFEAHPSIIEGLLDNLCEEAKYYRLPEKLGNKVKYYPYQAGYWALLLDKARSFGLKYFARTHEWELTLCQLIAFHYDEVDLEKFVKEVDNGEF